MNTMETITARRELNGMTKVDMEEYFDDVEVESLYSWIDRIPLSRVKKNISKDFADAGNWQRILRHVHVVYYYIERVNRYNRLFLINRVCMHIDIGYCVEDIYT